MIWLLKIIQKRPSDNTIKIWRILFWLILSWALYYNLVYQGDNLENNFFWLDVSKENIEYIKYFFIGLWLVPLIMWITNICLLKKKYMRFIQIFFWIALFYISSSILPLDPNKLDVDTLLALMWFLPLVAWITWKCITTKCSKYKEKITKIRV